MEKGPEGSANSLLPLRMCPEEGRCSTTFLQTSLSEHIKAKGTEDADQPSVHVTLRNGQKYKIGRILDVSPQAFPSLPWLRAAATTAPP